MTIKALGIIKTAFSACVIWVNQLFSAVDGSGVVLAAFCIVLVIGLLFIPMRGAAVVRGMSSLSDFTAQATHQGKFSKPRKSAPNGRYVKGSDSYSKARLNSWAKGTKTNVRF